MTEKIMVVEDDEMIRNLIRLYLERNNYDVIEAANGEEAMQLFLQSKPAVVILDLMMPKVTGEEFCSWVRNDLGDMDVSIIMLTAKIQMEDKLAGLELGADLYLTK